jgi:hypothetical protein
MMVSGGTAWVLRDRIGRPPAAVVADQSPDGARAPAAMTPVDVINVREIDSLARPAYDAAVAELERAVSTGHERLRPETLAALEESLRSIDKAIAQAREALESDRSVYLNRHLATTMQRKLALLRQVAALAGAQS